MLSCYGCKNKNTNACRGCVGWSHYESDTLINPVLAMNIDKEIKMLDKHALNRMFGVESSERRENDMTIKKVYFNDPVTVVLWEDGTKTIVKAGEDDIYDPEKGLAMAIAKKALGNKGNYYEVFKKWLPEETTNTDRGKSIEPIVKNVKATNIGEDGLLLEGELTKTGEKFFEKVSHEKVDEKLTKFEVVHDADSLKVTAETVTERKIQWLSAKEVAEANGLSVECVRKQIKDGFIPLAKKVNGKWKIPCYVFDDHVEVKCM